MTSDIHEVIKLAREASREPLPDLDWDRIEHHIFERFDAAPMHPAPVIPPERAWPRALAIAAIAAGLALSVNGVRASSGNDSNQSSSHAGRTLLASDLAQKGQLINGSLDASLIRKGDLVIADSTDIRIHHEAKLDWILPQGSRASVESLSTSIQVSLDHGSMSALVTPRLEHDSFVVRIGRTRVGVHGTAFTLTRTTDHVTVLVEHGSVAVGPVVRRGNTTGWIMVAPAKAAFSLDGASSATFLDFLPQDTPDSSEKLAAASNGSALENTNEESNPAVLDTRPKTRSLSPRNADDNVSAQTELPSADQAPEADHEPSLETRTHPPSPPIPTDGSEVPERLTNDIARQALATFSKQVEACHRQFTGRSPESGITVTVRTSVRITVAPDGRVVFGRFYPPLVPVAQTCASNALGNTVFPRARTESLLQVSLEF